MFKELTLGVAALQPMPALRSMCLLVGPYRNLSTLTASVLYFHRHCVVLNHAGQRILGDPRVDFLADYTDARFRRFVRFAMLAARGGRRGEYGGSITFSHAFQREPARQALARAKRQEFHTDGVQSLVWKESLLATNQLRRYGSTNNLFARNPLVRLLVPIRHPLDCAVSGIRTGHAKLLHGVTARSSVRDVVAAILDEFLWARHLADVHAGRVLFVFEHEFGSAALARIERFLGVDADPRWPPVAEALFVARPSGYRHAPGDIAALAGMVEQRFASYPDLREGLMAFVDKDPSPPR